MRCCEKSKLALLALSLLAFTFVFVQLPLAAKQSNSSPPVYGPPQVYGPPKQGVWELNIEPPEVILNDQKIVFKKRPIFDGEGWLFPIEEIAEKLQDNKLTFDTVNGVITVERIRDRSVINLDIRTGTVTVNNRPFRTLFGYKRIVLSQESAMVPTSAIVLLLGLTSNDNEAHKLFLKNTIGKGTANIGTIQPMSRTSLKDLLVDYLTVTNSFDFYRNEEYYIRRAEVNAGFHNDSYAFTTDFITRAGTGSPLFNFDSATFSYYKKDSPLEVHVGDKTLSEIRSPLLGSSLFRGVQVKTEGKIKDSKIVFGTGFLPTNAKVVGVALPFPIYGRIAQISEWSSSPEKDWQLSLGEGIYSDRIQNVLIRSRQNGGLLTAKVTKTGKYVEADADIGFGITSDEKSGKSQGLGGEVLVRYKPTEWLSVFSNGAYFTPGFFPLSSNPYYNDRNEIGGGLNLNIFRSNFGISHSVGNTNLRADSPDSYSVSNVSFTSTPFESGPTFLLNYSQNKTMSSSTRAIEDLLFPINDETFSTFDLEEVIERTTSSFFRASLLKSFSTFSFSSSFNYFTFGNKTLVNKALPLDSSNSELWTYDVNLNKSINNYLTVQNFFQGARLFKQFRLGFLIGPVFKKKLSLQLQAGALVPKQGDTQPVHSVNLNYDVNTKNRVSLNFNKTPFISTVSALWQYNMKPHREGELPEVGHIQNIGRIQGKVIVLEKAQDMVEGTQIALPSSTLERGIENVRVHLGNYTVHTNEKGEFEFQSLSPGVHRIRVEYSDLPAYLTSITPEAVDIQVEPGKETNFNFVLAYFGSLSGKLKLVGRPDIELEEEPELRDIRVYLEDTNFETLTNYDGSFVLGDVKPGKYTLRVDPEYLPEGLDVDKSIEIEIKPKEEIENISLPIKFKERKKEIKEF